MQSHGPLIKLLFTTLLLKKFDNKKKFFRVKTSQQRHLVLLFDPNYRPFFSTPKQNLTTVWQPSMTAEILTETRSPSTYCITWTIILFRYKANREVVNFCCDCKYNGHFPTALLKQWIPMLLLNPFWSSFSLTVYIKECQSTFYLV